MTPLTKALDTIRRSIPRPILEQTFFEQNFLTRSPYANTPVSLDAKIRQDVIDSRVIVDCSLNAPIQEDIPLAGLPVERLDSYHTIVRIPKDRTNGRSIIGVYSLGFAGASYIGSATYANGCGGSAMVDAAYAAVQATMPIPVTSTNMVTLVGENMVLITDSLPNTSNTFLRCALENDTEMSKLKPQSYQVFSDMVVLAVKSHIYNEQAIKLDVGQLQSGVAIGRFKEIVDSFSDAEERYLEKLNTEWRKVALLNNDDSRRRILAMACARH